MCGRFSVNVPKEELETYYDAVFEEDTYRPRYNAAPSQELPVILDEDPKVIKFVDWGLHPAWFKFSKGLINLKAETMAEKPFMRKFLSKRCLIPATGFFEWKTTSEKKKIPYWIRVTDRPIFSFAGVWEQEKDASGNLVNHFSIITTKPNELMEKIHTRMPVILSKEQEDNWLLRDLPSEFALQLLNSYPANKMNAAEISDLVNNPKNDTTKILNPI